MNYASKVIEIAETEVGYLEKKSNSQLDDKTANAGYNNYTKYGRDMRSIYPQVNINASTSLHISASNLQMATPTGYKPLAIVRFNSGEQDIYVRNVNINATSTASAMSVKNTATSNKSNVTATLLIAYIKSAYIVA